MWPASWNTAVIPGATLTDLVVGSRLEAGDGLFDILQGVDGMRRLGAGLGGGRTNPLRNIVAFGSECFLLGCLHLGDVSPVPSFPALGEFALKLGGVTQDDGGQVGCGGGGMNRPAVSRRHQGREPAAMIEVGMGQQDRVKRVGWVAERHPIAGGLFRASPGTSHSR